jgi:hypothetical protein
MTTILSDVVLVETEHLISDRIHRGLVKFRVTLEDGSIALAQFEPDAAREIAAHLFESAARAEYEEDAYREMRRAEWSDEMIGGIFHLIRVGEFHRHTDGDTTEEMS